MPHTILEQGILAYQTRDKDRALELFTQAVRDDPTDPVAWYWLGKCVPDPEKARYCFNRAAMIDSSYISRIKDPVRHLEPPAAPLIPVQPFTVPPEPELPTQSPTQFSSAPTAPALVASTPDMTTPAAPIMEKPKPRLIEQIGIGAIAMLATFLLCSTPIYLLVSNGAADSFIPVPTFEAIAATDTPKPFPTATATASATPRPSDVPAPMSMMKPSISPAMTVVAPPVAIPTLPADGQIDLYYSQADDYFARSDFASEIQVLDKAVALAPNDPYPYMRRGATYLYMTDHLHLLSEYLSYNQKAIADFDKAVDLSQPDHAYWGVYSNRAIAYNALNQGNLLRMDRKINHELALQNYLYSYQAGADERALVEATTQLVELGRWDEAEKIISQIHDDGLENVVLLDNMASITANRGNYQQAMDYIDQEAPGYYTDYRKALIYYYQGQKTDSFDTINESITKSPSFGGDRYFLRALLYFEKGEDDEAWNDLQIGAGNTWSVYGLYDYVMGKLLIKQGYKDEGIQSIQQAEASLPWDMAPMIQKVQRELKNLGVSRMTIEPHNTVTATPLPSEEFRPTDRPTPSSGKQENLPFKSEYLRIIDPVKGIGKSTVFYKDPPQVFHFQPEHAISAQQVDQLTIHLESPNPVQQVNLTIQIWSPSDGTWVYINNPKWGDNPVPTGKQYMTQTGEVYIQIENTGSHVVYLDNLGYTCQITLKDGSKLDYGLDKPLP